MQKLSNGGASAVSGHVRLKAYHRVWLSVHPNRSEQWLLDRMADGFDIHHMDGDHSNNCPENLILIEHADHMRLHTGADLFGDVDYLKRVAKRWRRVRSLGADRQSEGAFAYEQKAAAPIGWGVVALRFEKQFGARVSKQRVYGIARQYAHERGLLWPPSVGGNGVDGDVLARDFSQGRELYNGRMTMMVTWGKVIAAVGFAGDCQAAIRLARNYAIATEQPWLELTSEGPRIFLKEWPPLHIKQARATVEFYSNRSMDVT